MLRPRTLRVFAVLVAAYGLLAAPEPWWPNPVSEALLLVPVLSIYFFHALGVPGLLEHRGMCGWGWCDPTPFGWVVMVAFWLGVALLFAWGISRLTERRA